MTCIVMQLRQVPPSARSAPPRPPLPAPRDEAPHTSQRRQIARRGGRGDDIAPPRP